MRVPQPSLLAPTHEPTNPGDIWHLGDRHRLMCGDATSPDNVARLTGGKSPACIVTDPPYSSGGFQDSQRKSTSSKGSADHTPIRGDMLSARGYAALMHTVLAQVPSIDVVYLFGDWRMWPYNFDLLESCGLGVRNMIVWDKINPGMGMGWRSQHELIMLAVRRPKMWNEHRKNPRGNVVQHPRTKNRMHATQKPVGLIAKLLDTTPFVDDIYDPFAGSGSTIIAAERAGKRCFAMEIDPRIVDVAVRCWEVNTGEVAKRDRPRTLCVCGAFAAEGIGERATGLEPEGSP